MTNGSSTGISAYDIPAILDPVSSYWKPQLVLRRFPSTVVQQKIRDNKTNHLYEAMTGHYQEYAVFKEKNYFGKVLGPHLKAIMEIMFQCMLRPVSIPRERFFQDSLSDLYANLKNYMKFPISVEEPFTPLWQDHLAFNKTPYWFAQEHPLYIYFFEHKTDPTMTPFSSTSNTIEQIELIRNLKKRHQMQQMMALCQGPGSSIQSCESYFQPVFTDLGICFAFNAYPFSDTYHMNPYLKTFQNIFAPDSANSTLVNNWNSGKAFQMYIILDNHLEKVGNSVSGSFKIAINQNMDFMDVATKYIHAQVGVLTKISVVPTPYVTSDSFKKLPLGTRECRFANENANSASIFKYYSYRSCLFECHVQHAADSCGCTPWNYPHLGNETSNEICDGMLSYCFKQKMREQVSVESSVLCSILSVVIFV
jgi:hypothetical protein